MRKKLLSVALLFLATSSMAQTDGDAIMMQKHNFCGGAMYGYSSWKNYWEGTLKRDNENLGTVSTQMVSIMGNYGITDKLNVLFGVPWIQTKASAGTLHGLNGIQDLSLWVKYMPIETKLGKGTFSLYGLGGLSTPLSNYVADFQPLAIGLHSTTLSGRIMADYQLNKFFATASGTYTYRNNIHIDRTAYYTTELHLTNEVEMPDMASFAFRTGYRSNYLIAEAVLMNNTTLGGFDIRRNDMPFPSNKMNGTAAGINIKYTFKKLPNLSLVGGANTVLAGRNIGQSTGGNAGVFYIFNLSHKKAKSDSTINKN